MSHIYLELDTTPPQIEIIAPPYTDRNKLTTFIIKSNEKLSENHIIYIVDSNNIRHDLIFQYMGDSFYGEVYFNNYPVGKTTIYVEVKDEVDNLSVSSYSFLIHETNKIFTNMKINLMKNSISLNKMNNKLEASTMKNKMVVM